MFARRPGNYLAFFDYAASGELLAAPPDLPATGAGARHGRGEGGRRSSASSRQAGAALGFRAVLERGPARRPADRRLRGHAGAAAGQRDVNLAVAPRRMAATFGDGYAYAYRNIEAAQGVRAAGRVIHARRPGRGG